MAKILYGIHGTGHGHAMRGLTIARALPQHEFLFVANDDARVVLDGEFKLHSLPNLGTVFKNYKVDMPGTVAKALPLLLRQKKYIKETLKLIEDFRPDVCMTDLEFFVPRAARQAGLPCLTLDHQHIITCCEHKLPADMRWDAFLQGLSPRFLFPPTDYNLLVSFYAPPVRVKYKARVVPPILRERLMHMQPTDEGHILVYQSNSTDRRLIDFLRVSTSRPAYVFGYGEEAGTIGNIRFRPRSEEEFLDLLQGAAYVIQGGSHTLMSEALFLGKPILSLPIMAMLEQRFNAFYLEKLGYGRKANMSELSPAFLEEFETALDSFRNNISRGTFLGNAEVFKMVDHFARNGTLPQQ